MANATTRLGLVPTMSTSFYPPFLMARLDSTIDHIARGLTRSEYTTTMLRDHLREF